MAELSGRDNDVAIVGMAARLPGARTAAEFWANLQHGVESVRAFTDAELAGSGVAPEEVSNPLYVKSGILLEDFDGFDAEFFGLSPKEAAIMDPQHRQFLECAWEALEDAGHPPESFEGSIGVFGGCGMGAYFALNLLTNRELLDSVGLFLLRHTGNDKDFLTTRVSYCFDLRGPSVNVQTACSTSLVAAHLACQSLLSGECDMALAGGVTIEIPHGRGYLYQPGEILSPDGHCRAFDRRAEGTIFGSGAGIVVLRRLSDAIRDGDVIYAVIKGSAVNNDGSGKVGYLAPSVDGQAAAVTEALAMAGVGADSIGYVECHGTGTKMGDPIEIAALAQAFRQSTAKTGFCAIGSVKTNIGHLDTAAGVASLIKTSLALSGRKNPPSLHFEAPNPEIDFASSPFFVSRELSGWTRGSEPRRAGVNSLGVGGTNAFVVVEEAPEREAGAPSSRPYQLLVLSARTPAALDAAGARLAEHLKNHPTDNLADIAHTLQIGRRAFSKRRVLAARNAEEAALFLEHADPRRVFGHDAATPPSSVAFLFPGGGAQYPRMGHGLYQTDPVFREWIDRGLEIARRFVGADLKSLLFPRDDALAAARATLERPSLQLPAIFIIEHALAHLWMSWGVHPAALMGHSMGENTAACLAGVFRFEDCLGLVALRGQLMDEVEAGGMLSVALSAAELAPLLGDHLDLASINAPELSVASGPRAALEELERKLAQRGVEAKWIPIHIAAHSRMLEPILPRYGAYLKSVPLSEPKIPVVSNLTGKWLTSAQATDPEYWCTHLRRTVLFADGIQTLLEEPRRALLEVGPGKTLSSLARQHPKVVAGQAVLSSLRHADEAVSDDAFFLTVFGRLWATGLPVDFAKLRVGERRRRVSLPAYPFQHQRYFIEPGKRESAAVASNVPTKLARIDDWLYRPIWKPAEAPGALHERTTWLLFVDESGLGDDLAEGLGRRGHEVITVRPSDAYYQLSHNDYRLSPEHGRDGYDALVRDLVASGKMPDRIAHLWLIARRREFRPGSSFLHRNQERGFYSLLFLAQALGEQTSRRPMHIVAVSSGMQQVEDEPLLYPDQATILGPCKVIPREIEGVTCSSVDIALATGKRAVPWRRVNGRSDEVVPALMSELLAEPGNRIVALRGRRRFERAYEKVQADDDAAKSESRRSPKIAVTEGGTYVITGGLGGIGLTMARHFAANAKVNLVLVTRSAPRGRKLDAVRDLEAGGAEVMVITADVTDPEKMRQGFEHARRRFGKLNGVVHAAGMLSDELLQVKSQSSVENVFAPKVYGTLVLDSLLAGDRLDFFVLFSSTSVVTGPAGQIDYVAANAFLDAYAQSKRHDRRRRTVALGWGVWNEVGMAAEVARAMGRSPGKDSARGEPASHRLTTYVMGPRTHWILDEHRTIDGRALVPGTAYLEMAALALTQAGEALPFEVRDLFFVRALAVADDRQKQVRTVLRPNEQGYDFEVSSRDKEASGDAESGEGWELHAQAKVILGSLGDAAGINLSAISSRCRSRTDRDAKGLASGQERYLRFGPRWRVLREASYGPGEALGILELSSEHRDDLQSHPLHPALLDIATGFAMDLIDGYTGDSLWVPVSYRSVRVRGSLPARLVSWVRTHGGGRGSRDFASFDVVLADERGEILVEVDELTLRKLPDMSGFAAPSAPAAHSQRDRRKADSARALSPAELAFLRQLEKGILPAEGCEAFDRVLERTDDPVVISSSIDLPWLVARAEGERPAAGVKFARPDLRTSYVAPRDEIERTLVGFWQELLGVAQVGVEDNFFDLGGHSLVAVRLFAKIKTTYRVDYPISILFEAPTVEMCAALLREAVGAGAAGGRDSVELHRTRLTHLVPMHPASSKSAGHDIARASPEESTPFFLVAGMFGNVLNLRHLAHLIGQDRPFYGLQARGLYGDHTPHETFQAMAADYIAELRTVQPKGPYLLGGFSGGGITAYEIARQLKLQGESIALLVLLDTPLPFSPELTSRDRWMLHVERLRRRGVGHVWDWMKERYAWETDERRRHPVQGDAKRPFDFHSEAIEAAFRRALERYRLEKMPFRVALFRPKLDEHAVLGPGRVINRERRFIYFDNGWGPYVDSVEVFEMPGDHDSMVLEPNVRVLAARLRECIEKAEATAVRADSLPPPPRPSDDAIVA